MFSPRGTTDRHPLPAVDALPAERPFDRLLEEVP